MVRGLQRQSLKLPQDKDVSQGSLGCVSDHVFLVLPVSLYLGCSLSLSLFLILAFPSPSPLLWILVLSFSFL